MILDSGAVIALAARKPLARMFIERALREQRLVVVPAVVIAETTRGGSRDAPINRVLKEIEEIVPITEVTARVAGRLLAEAGLAATVDALVAAEAVLGDAAVVLTGDVADLSALVARHPHVRIEGI